MLTSQLKTAIDRLWNEFWTGGIANPLTVIEQITFLMFARLLDIDETRHEKMVARMGTGFGRQPNKNFGPDQQELRWGHWRNLGGDAMLVHVRDRVFPHLRDLGGRGSTFGEYMKDAALFIQKPSLLVSAVTQIEQLPLADSDIKGDLYEYMLGKLTTAGINGQFRTPRHIIRLMVDLLEPRPDETIGDPACGTAGFLVGVMAWLLERYSSPELIETLTDGSKSYPGDRLEPWREHIQNHLFHGYDFDATMLRIAAMNLMLHGVENPDIHYQDTLSKQFPEKYPRQAEAGFDLILANPPFKGSLAEGDVHPSLLKLVKTKKTELLFIALILRMLKTGGRSATIVPDGVLFGSSKAHLALRQHLIDDNQLEAVISLPAGVFKPYAGVSTAILVFAKGGHSGQVFFYDVRADGLSLDDKRQPVKENDLPDVLAQWRQYRHARAGDSVGCAARTTADPMVRSAHPTESLRHAVQPGLIDSLTDRTAQAFLVPADEIRANKYDLSLNRYQEAVHEAVRHDPPQEILARMKALEAEIAGDLAELEGML